MIKECENCYSIQMHLTLHLPSESHTGFGSSHDPVWHEQVASSPDPKQTGVVAGQAPLRLPQTHCPLTQRLVSPGVPQSLSAQGSELKCIH